MFCTRCASRCEPRRWPHSAYRRWLIWVTSPSSTTLSLLAENTHSKKWLTRLARWRVMGDNPKSWIRQKLLLGWSTRAIRISSSRHSCMMRFSRFWTSSGLNRESSAKSKKSARDVCLWAMRFLSWESSELPFVSCCVWESVLALSLSGSARGGLGAGFLGFASGSSRMFFFGAVFGFWGKLPLEFGCFLLAWFLSGSALWPLTFDCAFFAIMCLFCFCFWGFWTFSLPSPRPSPLASALECLLLSP